MNNRFCLHGILSPSLGNRTQFYFTFVYSTLLFLPYTTQPQCNHLSHYFYLPHPISPWLGNEHVTHLSPFSLPVPRLWFRSEMIQGYWGSGAKFTYLSLTFSNRSSQTDSQWVPNWDIVSPDLSLARCTRLFLNVWVFQCSVFPINSF